MQVIKPQIIQKPQNQSCTQIYTKQNLRKHRTQNFEELVPSVSPLLKKHTRLEHAGIVDHSSEQKTPEQMMGSTKEKHNLLSVQCLPRT